MLKSSKRIGLALAVGLLISTLWPSAALLSRLHLPVYLTLSMAFASAALILFLCQAIGERRLPQLSLRVLHGAVTVGTLCFFISGYLSFQALKYVSPVILAMAFGLVPLWAGVFGAGRGVHRPVFLVAGLTTILLYFVGTPAAGQLESRQILYFVCAIASSAFFGAGIFLIKKLLWMHSPVDLNIWSLFFASVVFAIFATTAGEVSILFNQNPSYWVSIAYFGGVVMGLTAYLYRAVAAKVSALYVVTFTALVAAAGMVAGALLWHLENPLNLFTAVGALAYIGVLVLASRSEGPSLWLSHFVTNTVRQGDRVMCHLTGFIKGPKGGIGRIELTDISVGGLGFRTDTFFPVADSVVISLPLGQAWTQLSLDCRIVHIGKSNQPEFAWTGGVEFMKLPPETQQVLLDILIRLGKPAESAGTSSVPKRAEGMV